ncbi:MAG: RNA-binding S4 domain-containing protein [Bacteroidales bacterium]|nr:RNA-binding S4 domain-containing protein [Bacteroidales bacterium]
MARLDKYLWAIRAFKTRTEAAEACKGGRVHIGGVSAKPAREVAPGDILLVRKGPVQYTYEVIQPLEQRVGAALVPQYARNLTPDSELQKLHAPVEVFFVNRDRGSGRPTKKERREIDRLWDSMEGE